MIERLLFVRDNFLSEEECDALIMHYERANKSGFVGEGVISKLGATITDSNIKCSDDWQIGFDDQYSSFLNALSKRLNRVIMDEFLATVSDSTEFDARCILNGCPTAYSTFQLQRYSAGHGHFRSWHIESIGKLLASRIFAVLIYLNTLEEGMHGETEFLLLNKKIRPVAGRLLVHPAGYPFVHRGNQPSVSDKYVLISWLEYV